MRRWGRKPLNLWLSKDSLINFSIGVSGRFFLVPGLGEGHGSYFPRINSFDSKVYDVRQLTKMSQQKGYG